MQHLVGVCHCQEALVGYYYCCIFQVDAQLLVVQKLEEKEGVLQSTLAALEKELSVRTQALELNKRKVRGAISHTVQLSLISALDHFSSCDMEGRGKGAF